MLKVDPPSLVHRVLRGIHAGNLVSIFAVGTSEPSSASFTPQPRPLQRPSSPLTSPTAAHPPSRTHQSYERTVQPNRLLHHCSLDDGNLLDDGLARSLLLLREDFSPPLVSGDVLGSRTLSLRRDLTLISTVLFILAEDDPNENEVLGKQQSQSQLPAVVRRDGPGARALGTLFFIHHRSLSHCRALGLSTVMSPRSCSTSITRVSGPSRPLSALCSPRRYRCIHPPEARIVAISALSALTAAFPSPAVPCADWMNPRPHNLTSSHHPHKNHRQRPYRLLQS